MDSSRSKFALAVMPMPLTQYTGPKCKPPLVMAETRLSENLPTGCKCRVSVVTMGSDMPMWFLTPTATPADLPAAAVIRHGSMAMFHLEFLAVCSAADTW